MEVGRSVIAFDDREGAAGLQHGAQPREREGGLHQMFEHETHEHVVERRRWKRQLENIGLLELDVAEPRPGDGAPRGRERGVGQVDRHEAGAGAPAGQRDGLRAHAAAGLKHAAAGGIVRVAVQQLDESAGLVAKAPPFAPLVSVHVVHAGQCGADDTPLRPHPGPHPRLTPVPVEFTSGPRLAGGYCRRTGRPGRDAAGPDHSAPLREGHEPEPALLFAAWMCVWA